MLSQAVTASGDPDQAEAIAQSISEPSQRARALTVVAQAIAMAGD